MGKRKYHPPHAVVTRLAKELANAHEPTRGAMHPLISSPLPGMRQVYLWRYYVDAARVLLRAGWNKGPKP